MERDSYQPKNHSPNGESYQSFWKSPHPCYYPSVSCFLGKILVDVAVRTRALPFAHPAERLRRIRERDEREYEQRFGCGYAAPCYP